MSDEVVQVGGSIPSLDSKLSPSTVEDNSRRTIAFILVTLYAITIVSVLAAAYNHSAAFTRLNGTITNLLSAETGLLGSVLGFYFGAKAKN